MVSALGKWKWWRSAFNFGRVCAKLYQTAGKRATLSTTAADDRGRDRDRKHRDTMTEIHRIRVFMTILLCHLTVSPKISSSHSCCPRWRVKQDCGRGKGLAHWATEFVFAGDACWPPTAVQYYLFKDSYDKAWSHYKGNWHPFEKNTSWAAAAAIINTCSPGLSVCLSSTSTLASVGSQIINRKSNRGSLQFVDINQMLIFVSCERPVNYSSVDSWAGIPTPHKPPKPSSMNIQILALLCMWLWAIQVM